MKEFFLNKTFLGVSLSFIFSVVFLILSAVLERPKTEKDLIGSIEFFNENITETIKDFIDKSTESILILTQNPNFDEDNNIIKNSIIKKLNSNVNIKIISDKNINITGYNSDYDIKQYFPDGVASDLYIFDEKNVLIPSNSFPKCLNNPYFVFKNYPAIAIDLTRLLRYAEHPFSSGIWSHWLMINHNYANPHFYNKSQISFSMLYGEQIPPARDIFKDVYQRILEEQNEKELVNDTFCYFSTELFNQMINKTCNFYIQNDLITYASKWSADDFANKVKVLSQYDNNDNEYNSSINWLMTIQSSRNINVRITNSTDYYIPNFIAFDDLLIFSSTPFTSKMLGHSFGFMLIIKYPSEEILNSLRNRFVQVYNKSSPIQNYVDYVFT